MNGLGMLYFLSSFVFFLGFWPKWVLAALDRQKEAWKVFVLLFLIGGLSPIIGPLFLAAWLYEQSQKPSEENEESE